MKKLFDVFVNNVKILKKFQLKSKFPIDYFNFKDLLNMPCVKT